MASINRHFRRARRGDLIRHQQMQTLNDAARITLRDGDTIPHIRNVLGNFERQVPDQPIEFGILDEDLLAGSHATMSVYRYTPSGWADSNLNIEVYDESGVVSANQGDFVMAVWYHRHYIANPVSLSRTIRHAKIIEVCACAIYRIRFVDRTFDLVCSSSAADPIEICGSSDDPLPSPCFAWVEADVGSEDYAGDITARPFGFDATSASANYGGTVGTPRFSLPVGTDVIVAKIGDTIGSSSSSSANSSSSGNISPRWWIIEAELPWPGPSIDVVTDVRCVTQCDGTTTIDICTTKVYLPPGSYICSEECPPLPECSSS